MLGNAILRVTSVVICYFVNYQTAVKLSPREQDICLILDIWCTIKRTVIHLNETVEGNTCLISKISLIQKQNLIF